MFDKAKFSLVQDTASHIVEIIWPSSVVAHLNESNTCCKGNEPLHNFIQQLVCRSQAGYSALQVALYYLIKIKPFIRSRNPNEQSRKEPTCWALQCGRHMFLAALMLACKYIQDWNYSANAWGKISGLNIAQINRNELMFLDAIGWKLYIPETTFRRWADIVFNYMSDVNNMCSLNYENDSQLHFRFAEGLNIFVENCIAVVHPALDQEKVCPKRAEEASDERRLCGKTARRTRRDRDAKAERAPKPAKQREYMAFKAEVKKLAIDYKKHPKLIQRELSVAK